VSSLTYRRRRASGINLMSDLRLLELSLEAANIGTAADASYDYPTACANYAKAVKYFSTIIQRASANQTCVLSDEQMDTVKHWQLVYQQRLAGLEAAKTMATRRSRVSKVVQVRKTSLSKIPFVEDVVPREHCPRPPAAVWRRPYWLLKRLQSSVNGGGFVAPSVYVSALVWSQKGAKISGLSDKMENYQNIYQHLTTLQSVPLPSDGKSWRTMYQRDTSVESLQTFEAGLKLFLDQIVKAQNALAHSLSYVSKAEGSVADHKQGLLKRALIKVSKVYDRTANESMGKRVSGTNLQQYAALIACIGERAQFIDGWLSYFEAPGCEAGKGGALPPGVGTEKSNHVYGDEDADDGSGFRASQIDASTSALPRIHRMLESIGKCLRDTVCMVVWRDLLELLERYLRKSRKAFVSNLEWQAENEVVGVPQSI
jgi:hypothetical protein